MKRTLPAHVYDKKGVLYFQRRGWQTTRIEAQVWTFKAHTDCAELGVAYRTKHRLWDEYDWLPMYELADDDHLLGQWRGHYPHAVCRLEFNKS